LATISEFCREFGVGEIGHITRLGRRCFLTLPEHAPLIERRRKELFGAGVYLGEEKPHFEPSPALLELVAAKMAGHKAVVDEKAACLFLCGRDLFTAGIVKMDEPTENGYVLVQDEQGENLGYGLCVDRSAEASAKRSAQAAKLRRRLGKNVSIKNLLDRGFYLRRERLA
jgi:ribosome biogenesis protein Nip4